MNYRNMHIENYEKIVTLWRQSEGVKLRDVDSQEGVDKYLKRNPGLSFVSEYKGEIIGTIMSGHDGKRGYIQHLVVNPNFRKSGVGSHMLTLCISALKTNGIMKSHIHILSDNDLAKTFWSSQGWTKRTDIDVYSYINGSNENA